MVLTDKMLESLSLSELFKEVNSLKTKQERIELLKRFSNSSQINKQTLQFYIESLLNPYVKLDLPDTIPPYKPNDNDIEDYNSFRMSKALTFITYFVKGTSNYIQKDVKREQFFIKILEDLHKDEAVLYAQLLLKTFDVKDYPKIKDELFAEAFPDYVGQNYISKQNDTKK